MTVRIKHVLPAAAAFATLLGCRNEVDATPSPTPSTPSSVASGATSASAQLMLDALDQRTPVPLLPMMANHQKQNMRDHLVAVGQIVAAVSTQDFDGVQKAAKRIGYSEQMGMMCQHMGAAAPGFTELSLKFHHTADAIGEAAKRRDSDGVLQSLGDTVALCTSCHQTFKQQIVSDAAWSALMKTSPPL